MPVTPKSFFENAITAIAGGGGAQNIYTNPASTKSIITSIVITNTNASIRPITMSKVPNSSGSVGTEALANRFLSTHSVQVNGEASIQCHIVLENTNDTIQAFSNLSGAINIQMMGVIIT